MQIAMTGASGLVGRALTARWRAAGHDVRPLARGVDWDPVAGTMPVESIAGAHAVVHLAGENVAARRWSEAHKRRIVESRASGTRAVSRAVAAMATRGAPPALLCASAIGWYGDRGDLVLDEDSPPGTGFMAESCVDWERAADPARDAGARVLHLRIGLVLAREGGALEKMLPPFRGGLGGRLSRGRHWMSWVTLEDVAGAFDRVLADTSLSGPVNVVAPNPVRNDEFTRILARVLHRPAVLAVPRFVLRALFGEMADELLLASARVVPRRLDAAGYAFAYPTLEPALRSVLR